MVYISFVKKFSRAVLLRPNKYVIKTKIISNQQLVKELYKTLIRKFEEQKVLLFLKEV